MADKVVINLEVRNGQAKQEVQEVADSIEKVQKQAAGASDASNDLADGLERVRDNGGAISVLDRLTGGLATQIRDAAEATKVFNANLKLTRGALVATGIGALAVAIGTVVSYWDEINDLLNQTNKKLAIQLETAERIRKQTESEKTILEKQIELDKLRGDSVRERREELDKILKRQKAEAQNELTLLELQMKRKKERINEVTTYEKIRTGFLKAIGQDQMAAMSMAEAVVGSEEERAELDAMVEKINTLRTSIVDISVAIQNNSTAAKEERGIVSGVSSLVSADGTMGLGEIENGEVLMMQNGLEAKQAIIEQEMDLYQQKVDAARFASDQIMAISDKESAFFKVALIAKQLLNAKEMVMDMKRTIFKAKLSVAESKIAIASGTAQTAKIGFPQNIPMLIGYAAQTAGIVSAISGALKGVKGAGSMSIPNVGVRGGSIAQAPQFNIVGGTSSNQILSTISGQLDRPNRAYVVSGDITSQQALDRQISSNASFDDD